MCVSQDVVVTELTSCTSRSNSSLPDRTLQAFSAFQSMLDEHDRYTEHLSQLCYPYPVHPREPLYQLFRRWGCQWYLAYWIHHIAWDTDSKKLQEWKKKRVFMLFAASKLNLKYAFNVQGTCWKLSISPILPGLLQHTGLAKTEQQLFKSTLSHLLTLSRPPIGPKHAVLQKTDTISNSTFWLYFHPIIKYYQKKRNRIFLRQNSVRLKLNSRCSLPRESYSPGLAGLAAVTKPCTSTSCTHTL